MSETDQRPRAAAPGSGPSPAAPVVPESAQMPTPLGSQHAQLTRWALWLRNFWPGPVRIDLQELLRMAFGVALGLLVTGMLSRWWTDVPTSTWMVSSLGASAVLLFGMPASPLAQPWPVLGGTVVSALVGALCQRLVPDLAVAAALSVGLSILLMVPLRCMHPPGAGFAAFVVLEHADGVALVAFPILFNVAVLVLCAVVYNTLTGKRYPHPQHSYKGAGSARFVSADLDAALSHYNQVLDISRADLEGLLHMAGKAAFQRTLGDLRCADIMSRPVFAVEPQVALKEAWALMRQEQVKALPVVDAQHQVLGIVSVTDFMRLAQLDVRDGLGQRLKHLVSWRSNSQGTVGDIMSQDVQVAGDDGLVTTLIPLFSEAGHHHHIPIVDAQRRLVGIVTQTDLVRTLSKTIGSGD
ncbi:HPP family protein [Comamonas sp. CMM03]|uniref:HPP family protein n=1 Tax=Comamonas sp. CMM03 TaxID=2854781 RepID=UPI00351D3E1E